MGQNAMRMNWVEQHGQNQRRQKIMADFSEEESDESEDKEIESSG